MPESADRTLHERYLRPEVLAKIGNLELRARMVVEGFFSGMHRSPYRGLSIEYADHRPYTQGDDFRHIDWKIFGRTDKYYIKEYEQETNLECVLVVDASESMTYRSSGSALSKYEYAAVAAASLAHLALHKQRDSVGLVVFDESIRRFVRPSRNPNHWRALVRELDRGTGTAKTSIRRVLDDLAERLDHRVLIIMFSDLLDDVDEVLKGLNHLRFRRHEMIVGCVWDEAEFEFPFRGPTRFEGLEREGHLLTEPRNLRDRYLAEVERFMETLRLGCYRRHMDFTALRTSTPLDVAIGTYLATRGMKIRKRSSRVLGGR
jgi:uncharacterized protein (DUF58 family)